MKILLLLLLCFSFLTDVKAEYRCLTDNQGRVIEAKLIKYDAQKDTVFVQRKGSSSTKPVPLSIFCKADQEAIRQWSENTLFLSERTFSIDTSKIKKKNESVNHSDYGSMATTFYHHYYNLTLSNKSTQDFNDILVEYVIYYNQEQHINENTAKEEREGIYIGSTTISIPAKTEGKIQTDKIVLKTYRESDYENVWPDLDGDIVGIIIKLSVKSGNETVSRQIKHPKDFKKPWVSEAKNVMPNCNL